MAQPVRIPEDAAPQGLWIMPIRTRPFQVDSSIVGRMVRWVSGPRRAARDTAANLSVPNHHRIPRYRVSIGHRHCHHRSRQRACRPPSGHPPGWPAPPEPGPGLGVVADPMAQCKGAGSMPGSVGDWWAGSVARPPDVWADEPVCWCAAEPRRL